MAAADVARLVECLRRDFVGQQNPNDPNRDQQQHSQSDIAIAIQYPASESKQYS